MGGDIHDCRGILEPTHQEGIIRHGCGYLMVSCAFGCSPALGSNPHDSPEIHEAPETSTTDQWSGILTDQNRRSRFCCRFLCRGSPPNIFPPRQDNTRFIYVSWMNQGRKATTTLDTGGYKVYSSNITTPGIVVIVLMKRSMLVQKLLCSKQNVVGRVQKRWLWCQRACIQVVLDRMLRSQILPSG
jgi:hypothetical protein